MIDPTLVKGFTQSNTFKGEKGPTIDLYTVNPQTGDIIESGLDNNGQPKEGYVNVLGFHTQRPFRPVGATGSDVYETIGFQGTAALLKHIFKKEYKIDIPDVEVPIKDLFPYTIRHHAGTDGTRRSFALPHDGHFGIEFIFRVKDRLDLNPMNTANYVPGYLVDDLRTLGVVAYSTRSDGAVYNAIHKAPETAAGAPFSDSATFREWAHLVATALCIYSGNKFVSIIPNATNNQHNWQQYPGNSFFYLQNTMNSGVTAPVGSTGYVADPISYSKDNIELYGYRLVEYDTDSVSLTNVTETDYSFKFSAIRPLSNVFIEASEYTDLTVKNVTHADVKKEHLHVQETGEMDVEGDTDLNDKRKFNPKPVIPPEYYAANMMDNNPIKCRVFNFVNGPRINITDYSLGSRLWGINNQFIGRSIPGSTPADDWSTLRYSDGNNEIKRVYSDGTYATPRVFNFPNSLGIIHQAHNGTDTVTFKDILPGWYFKDCSTYDTIIQPGESKTFKGVYSFKGPVKNFFKYILINNLDTVNGLTLFGTNGPNADYPGTSTVLMMRKLEVSNKSESMPSVDWSIYQSRKALCYSKKQLVRSNPQRHSVQWINTPTNSNVTNYTT